MLNVLTTLTLNLNRTYHAKHDLLESIMEDGFSITTYLTAKQEAILNSISDGTERKRRKRKEDKDKPKEKKSALLNRHITSSKLEKALKRLPKSED